MNQNIRTINESDIARHIIAILDAKPGLRAQEIAAQLTIDKKYVMRALYGEIKGECHQNEKYRWYLNKHQPIKQKEEYSKKHAVLSQLCRYYLTCLEKDDESGIGVPIVNTDDCYYVELNELPSSDGSIYKNSDVQSLCGKIRKDRGRMEMYFGYPTILKKRKSQKNREVHLCVEPVLLFSVDSQSEALKVSHSFPSFNRSVIKSYSNGEDGQWIDELVKLEEELNLSEPDGLPELDELVQKLFSIRPEWPWREEIHPHDLPNTPLLSQNQEEGIYNRAVLIVGERSPFTKGLEVELKKIAEISEQPDSHYERTALRQWTDGDIQQLGDKNTSPLLDVLPFNLEQRQAIEQSLEKPLTIITGPPGTGKSQVVTGLLINAAWQGKKILFASKNNKAVDVVEQRVNNQGNSPMLLRLGSGAHQPKLAEYLQSLLTSESAEEEQEEFDHDQSRYDVIQEQILQLENEEKELIRIRNATDELDQSVDKIRYNVSRRVFEYLKEVDTAHFINIVDRLEQAVKRAQKESHGLFIKLLWGFFRQRYHQQLQSIASEIEPISVELELNIPRNTNADSDMDDWVVFLSDLKINLSFAQKINNFTVSLTQLKNMKSLEKISREKGILMEQMSHIAHNLWKGWVSLRSNKLTNEDRGLISKYRTLLKMAIDAGGDLYKKHGIKVYNEYTSLIKKVSHLLPVYAITSLSTYRRIPLEPGYFDIVIFDEASQCDIASALPLLYRAKHSVVIGDPKQLQHICGMQKGQDVQLLQKYDLFPSHTHWAYSYNSLFDLAAGLVSKGDVINLRDHHRSHSDIIEFSNREFYENRLRVATNYSLLNIPQHEQRGVCWIDVIGSVYKPSGGGAINTTEGEVVIEEIRNLIINREYEGTIGVVTPFWAQANIIRRMISDDSELQARLSNHELLIDTAHKFQGDEKDVMFFSPVVSSNTPSGALNFLKNNGNLFNVAITRARAMLIVIGDQKAVENCDITYLKNFASYIAKLEHGAKKDDTAHTIEDLGGEYPTVTNPERVSEWEHIFYKALYRAGIKTIPQYQVEKYTLDLALFHGESMLDIEIDGERYHKNWTGELCRRDQIRNQRMFELGWDVQRFWVYEIRNDIDGCVAKINQWVQETSI